MFASIWKTLIFLGALLFQNAYAQQYLGDVIPNTTYPGVPGSEICYFRIKDPAGVATNLTLTNYYSLQQNGQRIVPSKVKRAIIIIHGLNRDPGTYMSNMLSALSQLQGDSNINTSSVAIMAPSFPNGDDKNISYPYWDYAPSKPTKKLSGGAQSWTNALVWKGSQWAGGGTNQYPTKYTTISSYEVLDQLVKYFADKSTFPNLNQIVVAGHSLGGQTVQRYAAVGKTPAQLGISTPVTYWIANPNSLVWLNSSRPLSTSSCSDYDDWRDGLSNYADYPNIYNVPLVNQSTTDAVIANYNSKNKAYARGTQDLGDDSSSCAPFTSGQDRNERFFNFINWWPPVCEAPNSTTGHCDTVDLINMGHDGGGMMASSAGLARLFTDNFYGDGARSYDFGYPRTQPTDDPYPNPAYNDTTSSTNLTVYAGNMSFKGCYTDSTSAGRTLKVQLYDSGSNSIEECTAACFAAGYSVAGAEYGSQCYCGNAIGSYAQKTLDLGCTQACAGNSSEICGGSARISVYSNSALVQEEAASNPEVVGNYFYSGCVSEATSGRALSAKQYSDGTNMTLENCAAFCNGYKYFGIEYAAECYCGSYFGTGSSYLTDASCTMVCTGDANELCGAGSILSVYQLESDAVVSTIVQSSTTAAAGGSGGSPTTTAAAIPTGSLCPNTNGQTLSDSNNSTYTIGCSSDTSVGSYTNAAASSSYLECMAACDAAASTGCVAWTYVGGDYGSGSGTCWLKNSKGSLTSAGTGYISGLFVSSGSSGSGSTTTSSASAAATTYANGSTPVVAGVTYLIQTDTTYSGTLITLSRKRATTVVGDCLRICAGSTSCVATAFDSNASTCAYYSGFDNSTKTTAVGTTFATVEARGSASSTSTSSTGVPTASLCPATNSQTVNGYTVSCSSDTDVGSYTSASTSSSYLDCMTACNSAASTGCVAWTYVGGDYGSGSGTCWLKNSKGSFTSAGIGYISGVLASSGSSASSSIQTSSTTGNVGSVSVSSATSTASSSLCPSVDSQRIVDSNNNAYTIYCSSDTTVGSFAAAQATKSYADCMTACDSTTGCVAFTYVGGDYGSGSGTCWLKNDKGSTSSAGIAYVAGFLSSKSSSSSSLTSSIATSLTSLSSSTVSSATSSASATGTLCPNVDSQDLTDTNGNVYTIKCSSDTSIGSFANAQATKSYADCMAACDATTGCVAFTYVGGDYGSGSGTCWLKNDRGTATSGGTGYVAGFLKSSSSSSSSVASTSSSATSSSVTSSSATSSSVASTLSTSSALTTSAPTSTSSVSTTGSSSSVVSSTTSSTVVPSASLCPSANGQIITDAKGNHYNVTCSADNSVGSYSNAQASTSYLDCMTACDSAAATGCQGFTYVGGAYGSGSGTCWLKSSMSDYPASGNNVISAVKISSGSSSSSSSSASSSSAHQSTSATSSTAVSVSSTSSTSSVQSTTSSLSSSIVSSSTVTRSSPLSSSSSSVASSTLSSILSSSATTLTTSTKSSTGTSSSSATSSTAVSLPSGFSSYGCFIDGSTRALSYSAGSSSSMTPSKCASTCKTAGYKYAGTEYSSECYCSNTAPTNNATASDCNMACSGDSTQMCGAGNRLSVYVDNTWSQKFFARSSYSTWNLMACYTDNTNGRLLPNTMSMTGGSSNATIASCLNACSKSGYKYCGAEYYSECYGSSSAPSSSLIAGTDPLASGCNYACTGNSTEACGGANKILVYVNNGTTST